jgi:predicted secreted protein
VFEDKRSRRVILIAHCVLNQNAKIDRCAHYPGMMQEITRILFDAGIGVIQMPCPELLCLGLDRQVDKGARTTIESEDTRVARRMAEAQAQVRCREIVADLVAQIEEYQKTEFQVLGVIGINGSPTCGVETTWADDQEKRGAGVFVRALSEELARRNIFLPMRGVKARDPHQAVAAVMELLGTHAQGK